MSTLDPHRGALERLRADLARVVEAHPELREPEARKRLADFLALGAEATDATSAPIDTPSFSVHNNSHGETSQGRPRKHP